MESIVDAVKRVAAITDELGAGTRLQHQQLERLTTSVASIDEMTQHNAALVEEAAAASMSLHEQAGQLTTSVQVFQLAPSATHPA